MSSSPATTGPGSRSATSVACRSASQSEHLQQRAPLPADTLEVDERYERVRAWVQGRGQDRLTVEELMVTAPFPVRSMQVPHFEKEWAAHRSSRS